MMTLPPPQIPELQPIVFLGPSLPVSEAAEVLHADYRPPIRRGDLEPLPPGCVVGIIDGVFDQNLAVSPREVLEAVRRGVRVFGAASMGALRASEVPGVVGIGRIYEMFKHGEIEADDEVAVAFDADSQKALCEPLVNIRHAVLRLLRPGTIDKVTANRIIRAARKLAYPDRVYARILEEAGIRDSTERKQLISMLSAHDLKRNDAVTLLEHLRDIKPEAIAMGGLPKPSQWSQVSDRHTADFDAPVHFWEFGPPLQFERVVRFLKLTGSFESYARRALPRRVIDSDATNVAVVDVEGACDRIFQRLTLQWAWQDEEEAAISLQDVGVGVRQLEDYIAQEAEQQMQVRLAARQSSPDFLRALRLEMFLDDLALKRESVRCASLSFLADRSQSEKPMRAAERAAAVDKLCELVDAVDERRAVDQMSAVGVSPREVDDFIEELARARRVAQRLRDAPATHGRSSLRLKKSPKQTSRFCWPIARAAKELRRIAPAIGITRVAMITGLGNIGIPNAQAFRPDGTWSSTVGSGKSDTTAGAKVGAIMEEVEKWAQERFAITPSLHEVTASYESLRRNGRRAIDPATLDLPYDSCYRPDLVIGWFECDDLIGGKRVLLPTAMVTTARVPNDICYSPRAGRRTFSTNGLASGFTLEEALTHAISEYIERHSTIMQAITESNPGAATSPPAVLIDLETLPVSTARLARKVQKSGNLVRIRDITAALGVPTFAATILVPSEGEDGYQDRWQEHDGHGTHPNPAVAVNMAVLEASQTIMTNIAGAREDLTLRARSLGRHERTWSRRRSGWIASRSQTLKTKPFASVAGFVSNDARADVLWLRDQLCGVGCEHLLAIDLSREEIAPAKVVRVIIPGLETTNSFHTGLRARVALLSDLV